MFKPFRLISTLCINPDHYRETTFYATMKRVSTLIFLFSLVIIAGVLPATAQDGERPPITNTNAAGVIGLAPLSDQDNDTEFLSVAISPDSAMVVRFSRRHILSVSSRKLSFVSLRFQTTEML